MKSIRSQWWAVGGIVTVLVALVAVGWSVRDRFLPVEVGTRAPNFIAQTLDGDTVSLDDLRGEVVLLNIWATWCAPCRDEMPSMQRLHERLGPEGLRIVAVSIDAPRGTQDIGGRPGGDVQAFVDELGLDFAIWLDPDGGVQQLYRTTGVPESFIIDRNGMIIKKVIGATMWDSGAHVDLINRLLES
ncbi:MAG TPA: TlpA disulfide reductase family protein [Longimicrobiaceae bacterium]|nr:TlpA disulfide reductase family protein [Longimicrobiaceae bacterium]